MSTSPAFDPRSLWVNAPEVAPALQALDDLKAELQALRPIAPDRQLNINRRLRVEWSFHSNALEGNTLTLAETKALLLHDIYTSNKEGRFNREMRAHDQLVKSLEALVQDDLAWGQTWTLAGLKQLHRDMLQEEYESPAVNAQGDEVRIRVKPGAFKTQPNHVRLPGGEVFPYAEPALVESLLENLLAWARTEALALHPLEAAARLHCSFIRIHPFTDGNGRLARILQSLVLMKAGYVPAIVRLENKSAYLQALRQADADLNLTPYLQFVARETAWVLELVLRGARGGDLEDLAYWNRISAP